MNRMTTHNKKELLAAVGAISQGDETTVITAVHSMGNTTLTFHPNERVSPRCKGGFGGKMERIKKRLRATPVSVWR